MKFTKKTPTEPGWYWSRLQRMGAEVAEVRHSFRLDCLAAYFVEDWEPYPLNVCIWGDKLEVPTVEEET